MKTEKSNIRDVKCGKNVKLLSHVMFTNVSLVMKSLLDHFVKFKKV